MKTIDLNCDMGELPELLNDGTQEKLLGCVSSVNVACGGHAGDPHLMAETILAAQRHGVAVGAHPGYQDREHFGRVVVALSPEELSEQVALQVGRLMEVARKCGMELRHGKAHGALYNRAAADAVTARAVGEGFRRAGLLVPGGGGFPLMGLAGSAMLGVFESMGFRAIAEAFVDRRYEADGSLRDRKHADALLADPEEAAEQALTIARDGVVWAIGGRVVTVSARTLCVHSDSPGAVEIAAAVRRRLEQAGFAIRTTHAPPR